MAYEYRSTRYADCDIRWNKETGMWEAFYNGRKRAEPEVFVTAQPGMKSITDTIRAMKLAKKGPWSETKTFGSGIHGC